MNYRNKKLLSAAEDAPCVECGSVGTTVAAHSNQLRDGKGMGIKAHDFRIAFLCAQCHFQVDQGKELSKQDKQELWENAHRKTIGYIFLHHIVK